VKGCLDEVTKSLISFEDHDDLAQKIDNLYLVLDDDGSGGLNFEEFQQGLMEMIDNMSIILDDFDVGVCIRACVRAYVRGSTCVYVYIRMCTCVCHGVCVCVCVCVCVRV